MQGSPSLLRLSILLGAVLILATNARAQIFDDFNDGNDAGWTRYQPLAPLGAPGTYTFPSGGYRIQAATSPDLATLGPGRAGATRQDLNLSNFALSVDLVAWDNTLDQGFGLVARTSQLGLGTSDGYFLHYNPVDASVVLDRLDNEVPTVIGAGALVLDPLQDYRMTFTGVGATLTARIFNLNNLAVPLITGVSVDATYAAGFPGVLVSRLARPPNGPADATFDNFSAFVPEPATATLLAAGLLVLCRRTRR